MPEPAPAAASNPQPIRVLTCWSGALVSASISMLLYRLTVAIATVFAKQHLSTQNLPVYRITIALRTLVVGLSALGTFIFGFVGVGLLALGIQRLAQTLLTPKASTEDPAHPKDLDPKS